MAIGRIRANPMGLKSTPVVRSQAAGPEVPEDRVDLGGLASYTLPGYRGAVRGQEIKGAGVNPLPMARYETRILGRTDQGVIATLDFRQMLKQESGHAQTFLPWAVGQAEIETYSKAAPRAGDRAILPKDHSLQVNSVELSLCTEPSRRYFEQLSQIGQIEGFHVVGLTLGAPASVDRELHLAGYQNYALHSLPASYEWLEDSSESLEGGTRLISGRFSVNEGWFEEVIEAGRQRRLGTLAAGMQGEYMGKVNQAGRQNMAAAQALIHGQPVRQAQSYLEGGNLLSGRRLDGSSYVLVGADTLEVTRKLMGMQSGTEPSLEDARAAVASDLGVPLEQLFAVEQPGAFHLDMRMMPVGPGQIVLQDSREAASLHLEWLKQEGRMNEAQLDKVAESLKAWADARVDLEDAAARDLEKAGLQVHRLAGAFTDIYDRRRDAVNFFNSRHGLSPQGIRYSILMGAPPQAESYFAEKLLEELKVPVDRLYFLDPEQTATTLKQMGGFKCRSKVQGLLASQSAPVALTPGPTSSGLQFALFENW